LPSLAALVPKIPACQSMKPSEMLWVTKSQAFFQTWEKLKVCMPKYEAFLQTHVPLGGGGGDFNNDVRVMSKKMEGRAMKEESQVALAEFYLAVALQLRPADIDAAGSDSQALLQVARDCAEKDFEPCIEQARDLVADYNAAMHEALEETSPFYEVDSSLFWISNFDIVAPMEFHHFLTALGHGSGQQWTLDRAHTSPKAVEQAVAEAEEALLSGDSSMEPARRAGELVYNKWLQASSMPVKAVVANTLMSHGLMVSIEVYQSDKLLPDYINSS